MSRTAGVNQRQQRLERISPDEIRRDGLENVRAMQICSMVVYRTTTSLIIVHAHELGYPAMSVIRDERPDRTAEQWFESSRTPRSLPLTGVMVPLGNLAEVW